MVKLIFTSLLCGFLAAQFSTVFAVDIQPSEQKVLWEKMKKETIAPEYVPERRNGPRLLTDEELDQVTGAGFGGFPEFPMFPEVPAFPKFPAFPEFPEIPKAPQAPTQPS